MPTDEEVERVARAICVAMGLNPETLHQNYSDDEPVDGRTESPNHTYHYSWRKKVEIAKAAIAAMNEA